MAFLSLEIYNDGIVLIRVFTNEDELIYLSTVALLGFEISMIFLDGLDNYIYMEEDIQEIIPDTPQQLYLSWRSVAEDFALDHLPQKRNRLQ